MILFISPKNKYATNRFLQEAQKQQVEVAHFDVQELAERNFDVDPEKYDSVYIRFPFPFLAQIIELANKFKRTGKKVVDASIALGDVGLGKMKNYEQLHAANVAIPQTSRLNDSSFTYPYIIKWNYGFKGRNVFLVRNDQERADIVEKYDPAELLAQEYIEAEYECKVMTVGYQALPVILKYKMQQGGFKVDMASGEVVQYSPPIRRSPPAEREGGGMGSSQTLPPRPPSGDTPPIKKGNTAADILHAVVSLAETASRITGRELAKVDILQKGDRLYILEVNRWPGFQSFEALSKYNVAGAFVKYLSQKWQFAYFMGIWYNSDTYFYSTKRS